MSKPQYAILRFAKYKGPEIGNIEAHNERTKEKYASNPDVDISRSKYNFHLIEPERKYRVEAERQIEEAGCRTRSDSVRVVEALVNGRITLPYSLCLKSPRSRSAILHMKFACSLMFIRYLLLLL